MLKCSKNSNPDTLAKSKDFKRFNELATKGIIFANMLFCENVNIHPEPV